MNAIYILWLRELKRYTRSRAQIVASLGQPMLYLLVLGFGLGLHRRDNVSVNFVEYRGCAHDASKTEKGVPPLNE